MTIRKLTDAEKTKLENLLIAPKHRTQLTKKEKQQNAQQLQEDREKDRQHTPRHKTQLVANSIGLYSTEIAARVYARLAKTARNIGCYHDHQTLTLMTQDIIPRYLVSDWKTETIAGKDRKKSTKRVACKKCAPCTIAQRKGDNPNRADCKDVQLIERPARNGLPAPRTLNEWVQGLMIQCCSWSYCENRGYLASDERLTHADWQKVYRHAPKPHSLKSLDQMAQFWVDNDRISGVLLDAWLNGEIDERTEAIIQIKATAHGVNTSEFKNGKPIKLGLKNLHRGLNDIGIASTRAQTKQSLKDLAEVMTRAGYDKKGNWYGGHETENATSTVAVPATGMIALNSVQIGGSLSAEDLLTQCLTSSTPARITQERLIELLAQVNQPMRHPDDIGFKNAPALTAYNRRAHIGRPRQPEEIKQATEVMLAEKKRLEEFDRIEKTEKEFNQRMKRFTIDGLLPRLPKIKKPLPEMDDETRAIFGLPTSEAMQRWSKWSAEVLAGHIARAEEKGIVIDA